MLESSSAEEWVMVHIMVFQKKWVNAELANWDLKKMAYILQKTFSTAFSLTKNFHFDQKLAKVCSHGSSLQ